MTCLRPYRDITLTAASLVGQGLVVARDDPATGLRLAAAATAMRSRVGGEFPPLIRARVEEVRRLAEATMGPGADRVWKEGLHLGVDDAVALAFGAPRPRTASADGLSGPEREVARRSVGRLEWQHP